MHRSFRLAFAVAATFLGGACTPAASHADAASGDLVPADAADTAATDGSIVCRRDLDCSDNVFCNGTEQCMPGAPGANANGCVAATSPSPCLAMQTCNEAMRRCDSPCDTGGDADHDGHSAMNCGGDDCDDADANRFPGNREVCAFDSASMTRIAPTRDEDCNADTYADPASRDGDHDGDGFVDHACCNTDASGGMHCGDDCADIGSVAGMPASFGTTVAANNVHPSQTEVCNGVDDNCNGMIDEGLPLHDYYPDCDGDGAGAMTTGGAMTPALGSSCSAAQFARCMGHDAVPNNTDCDDAAANRHPGLTEVCNGVDDDCNDVVDDLGGATCRGGSPPATQPCHSCGSAGTQSCVSTTCTWSPQCSGTPTSFGPYPGGGPSLYHDCPGGYSCNGGHWCFAITTATPRCNIMGGPYVTVPRASAYREHATLYVIGSATVTIEPILDDASPPTYVAAGLSPSYSVSGLRTIDTPSFDVTECAPLEINVVLQSVEANGSIELVEGSIDRSDPAALADPSP
jgi:hypothetical protein